VNAAAARNSLAPFAMLSASYFAHVGFFNPYLPLWLKDMGFGLVAISLLTAAQAATRVIGPYSWGWLSDRTGERVKLLRYGATASLTVGLALFLDLPVVALFAVLLVMFIHTSFMMPMSEAAMAHRVTHEGQLDVHRYGRVRLWGSWGFLVTVMAAGWWFERHGLSSFPAWTVGTLVLVAISVWWMPDLKEPVEASHERLPIWPILRQPSVHWLFAAIFFHVFSHVLVYVFFSLYLDALGYSKTAIGLFWAVGVIVEIAWFYQQGRWSNRLTWPAWLVVASVLMVLRMTLTAGAAQWWWVLVFAQALHAVTFAAHHTACMSLISQHFSGRLRGRGQALFTVIGYGSTGVLGGLLGGVLSERWGLGAVFWLSSAAAVVAVFCGLQVQRLEARRSKASSAMV
jgi:PPP family 3-phenylpropionic acid transporter